ncbi:MAG TPA: helix-turn-helix domain-containing protein [Rhizomicrobium sp.]|nr:helix-turn-helix domain-containing protein [Rhizomicrobium sp.]
MFQQQPKKIEPSQLPAPQPGGANLLPTEVGAGRYLTPKQLAATLHISPRTLLRWDAQRTGPPRIKIGKLVLYDMEKLPDWLARFETKPVRAGR